MPAAIRTSRGTYERIPIRTRLITTADSLTALLDEYVRPQLRPGDLLFVSEKIVCITQGRIVRTADVRAAPLARFLASKVRNHVGTPRFRGLGHGTAPAMQLLIDEAGVARTVLAALAAALGRLLGVKGVFYYLVGKQAKSVDCPMSWTIPEFKEYAKLPPHDPGGVARQLAGRYGVAVVIADANYIGAFSLGKSDRGISERFVEEVLRDNPAGQDSEMTPFLLVREAAGQP